MGAGAARQGVQLVPLVLLRFRLLQQAGARLGTEAQGSQRQTAPAAGCMALTLQASVSEGRLEAKQEH